MFYYSIIVQFARANAPSFNDPKVKQLIEDAVNYYNSKSLLAANRKQIVGKKILDDLNLEIILESTAELQTTTASKALRVFSMYLIDDNTPNNLKHLITGKRLLKTLPSRIENYSPDNNIPTKDFNNTETTEEEILLEGISKIELDEVEMIHKFTELLQQSRKSNKAKSYAIKINNILNNYEKRSEN